MVPFLCGLINVSFCQPQGWQACFKVPSSPPMPFSSILMASLEEPQGSLASIKRPQVNPVTVYLGLWPRK